MANYNDSGTDVIVSVESFLSNLLVTDISKIPISKFLPEKFRSIQVWADLIGSFQKIVVTDIQDTLDRLRDARDPNRFEIELAVQLAHTLGYYQEISSKSDIEKRRLIESLITLYEKNGTQFTIKFLSWISEESLTLTPLWTRDYNTFNATPLGDIAPDGPWYLSNYVDIDYSAQGDLDHSKLREQFYRIAPVPLVIRNINRTQFDSGTFYATIGHHQVAYVYSLMSKKFVGRAFRFSIENDV